MRSEGVGERRGMPEGVAGREEDEVETAERREGGRRGIPPTAPLTAMVGDESGESAP